MKNKYLSAFIIFQLISLIGSELSYVAAGYEIYQHTKSVMSFSLVIVLGFLPNVIGYFVSGPFIDRMGFRKIFGLGDIASAALLLALALFGRLDGGSLELYTVIFLTSLLGTFQIVALRVYLPQVYTGDSLVRMNSWLSSFGSISAFVAPSLAGMLLKLVNLKSIFILDSISFVFSFFLLILCVPEKHEKMRRAESFWTAFRQGMMIISSSRELKFLICAMFSFTFFAAMNTVMTTPYVMEAFGQETATKVLGLLPFGSFSMGLISAKFPKFAGSHTNIPFFSLVICGLNVVMGLSASLLAISLLLFFLGHLIFHLNLISTLVVQKSVETRYLGRVFSFSKGLSWLGMPIGNLLSGFVADSQSQLFSSSIPKVRYIGILLVVINSLGVLVFLVLWRLNKKSMENHNDILSPTHD